MLYKTLAFYRLRRRRKAIIHLVHAITSLDTIRQFSFTFNFFTLASL